ncbi:SDR family oxidoreductase [Promicromonospora thailandica]|uniref:NAD(P)H dehydrogenase (Quinone) n=1 Tax=Promicromonospora thailandica TaxID=765201 RepID=A0A9X2G7V5_9MICO|nr:SDR family oxidoreductase [Promicromonospora thailandica]MCP2266967.1 NAD(P)H dehydrogenase (quinone) [Promicromonospora thailandica]BFF16760.1 SDR family oxidoreductase [Promicromonospora thailandica]
MTTYAVTGATGHLGRLAVAELLRRGVAPADVVTIARTPAKAADLADLGVQVREGDYDRPETLPAALAGVQRLLLVSGSDPGNRVAQHTAVIDAASAAGVERIAYTSIINADDTTSPLAGEHQGTERVLRASGVPLSLLRNAWYHENYTERLDEFLQRGEIVGAAADGPISAASRADFAAAAVAALQGDDGDVVVHELGGTPYTLAELAATITEVTGTTVRYRDLPADDLAAELRTAGLDAGTAGFVAALDASIAAGALDSTSDDLARLLGRPATPLADAVRAAAQG